MGITAKNDIATLIHRQYMKQKQNDSVKSFNYDAEIDYEVKHFHMTSAMVIKKDDDYFCGIRANHFVVEFGCVEEEDGFFLLVTANHKEFRKSAYFEVDDQTIIQYFTALDTITPVSIGGAVPE